jgi:hypothetical protein
MRREGQEKRPELPPLITVILNVMTSSSVHDVLPLNLYENEHPQSIPYQFLL